MPPATPEPPVIELLTRPGCHLCDAARHTVAQVCAEFGVPYTELNIELYPQLLQRHATEIPVLRIDGQAKDFCALTLNGCVSLLPHACLSVGRPRFWRIGGYMRRPSFWGSVENLRD